MSRPGPLRASALLALLLAAALGAAGWGHRLPAADPAAALRLLAFQQAGGDRDGLCGGAERALPAAACAACRLTDAPGLPAPAVRAMPAARAAPGAGFAAQAALRHPPCHPGWHGRAPPAV
jgi:hypothetical protein